VDWTKRQELPLDIRDCRVVLDPELHEALKVNQGDAPILLRPRLSLGVACESAARDEDADVLIAQHRHE
jgi:hypothetical protein